MRFMIGERQDESLAAPWTSAHAADGSPDVPMQRDLIHYFAAVMTP